VMRELGLNEVGREKARGAGPHGSLLPSRVSLESSAWVKTPSADDAQAGRGRR
jgi:hypothetical protein